MVWQHVSDRGRFRGTAAAAASKLQKPRPSVGLEGGKNPKNPLKNPKKPFKKHPKNPKNPLKKTLKNPCFEGQGPAPWPSWPRRSFIFRSSAAFRVFRALGS